MTSPARANAQLACDDTVARCSGDWTSDQLHEVEEILENLQCTGPVTIDLADINRLDSGGALLIHRLSTRLREREQFTSLTGANAQAERLLALVAQRGDTLGQAPTAAHPGLIEAIGRHAHRLTSQYIDFLAFVGEVARACARVLGHPRRLRVGIVVDELESAGVNALPIVGLLTFLMGVVIAYQGGVVLQDYGASIYIADIVGLSTVRELSPLITAIIVAGRTGSAYTAQIGTMQVTQEVDALRSVGIAPLESLVVPKLVALVIALPLLTVFGDFMGILGGMVMSATMLGLNSTTYIDRIAEALTLNSYVIGFGKAPVFAALIAIVGCFQGFRVAGSAASVGRRTTISVVQSIFLVLVVDAAFSVAFSKLDL